MGITEFIPDTMVIILPKDHVRPCCGEAMLRIRSAIEESSQHGLIKP
jgi:hypothetical protein